MYGRLPIIIFNEHLDIKCILLKLSRQLIFTFQYVLQKVLFEFVLILSNIYMTVISIVINVIILRLQYKHIFKRRK